MPKKKSKTQLSFLLDYYKDRPGIDIKHPEIVDWATNEFRKKTGKVFRDPDRGIRRLHQDGFLIKEIVEGGKIPAVSRAVAIGEPASILADTLSIICFSLLDLTSFLMAESAVTTGMPAERSMDNCSIK